MRYLVIGGSGFIGSHLTDALLAQGATRVTVMDLWFADDLRRHLGKSNFEFAEGDILDGELVYELCQEADVVYHLASILGTAETIEVYDPERVAEANVIGTLRVLKASRAAGVKRVIYPSTPDVPWLNPYKITKLACERFCQMFFREFGLETVVLRLTNVYGPRERWAECMFGAPYNYQKVVPTFIVRALRNEALPIFGDGEQTAVYVYVEDAVGAMIAAAHRGGCVGGIIPIGSRGRVSVRELAREVLSLTGSKSELRYFRMRPGEVKVDIDVDTRMAEDLLGFRASTTLREGLKRTIPYYERAIGVDSRLRSFRLSGAEERVGAGLP